MCSKRLCWKHKWMVFISWKPYSQIWSTVSPQTWHSAPEKFHVNAGQHLDPEGLSPLKQLDFLHFRCPGTQLWRRARVMLALGHITGSREISRAIFLARTTWEEGEREYCTGQCCLKSPLRSASWEECGKALLENENLKPDVIWGLGQRKGCIFTWVLSADLHKSLYLSLIGPEPTVSITEASAKCLYHNGLPKEVRCWPQTLQNFLNKPPGDWVTLLPVASS
jgi:hypothetical protein